MVMSLGGCERASARGRARAERAGTLLLGTKRQALCVTAKQAAVQMHSVRLGMMIALVIAWPGVSASNLPPTADSFLIESLPTQGGSFSPDFSRYSPFLLVCRIAARSCHRPGASVSPLMFCCSVVPHFSSPLLS